MRQYHYVVAAAAAMSLLAACSGGKSDGKSADAGEVTVIYDEPDEEICEPVTADARRDTTWKCAGREFAMRRLDRLAAVDADRYMSLSMMVPGDNSLLTAALMQLVDSNFYYYTGLRLPEHSLVTTPASMSTVLDTCATDFARRIVPAESVNGRAYNITIAAHPAWSDGRLYTYQIYTEADMGGAHPDSEYYYATYDSQSGGLLGFNDLVPLAEAQGVRDRLVARLAEFNGMDVDSYLKSLSEYILGGLDTEHEAMTSRDVPVYSIARIAQGYVFGYPAGSIAPAEEGPVNVTVLGE